MARPRRRGFRLADVVPEDGERRLMLAVLLDALRVLRSRGPLPRHLRSQGSLRRELAWIGSNDRSQPFSFVNVCEALGLEADYVRRVALRWSGRLVRHPLPISSSKRLSNRTPLRNRVDPRRARPMIPPGAPASRRRPLLPLSWLSEPCEALAGAPTAPTFEAILSGSRRTWRRRRS